jgi:hypothetical protein
MSGAATGAGSLRSGIAPAGANAVGLSPRLLLILLGLAGIGVLHRDDA